MSDTTTTTTRPTPAQDALEAYELEAERAREAVEADARTYWNGRSAKEAVVAARGSTPYRSPVINTKAVAITVLARQAWRDSDAHKQLTKLQRAANAEEDIYGSIEGARAYEAKTAADVVAKAQAAVNHDARYETVMDYVATARKAQVVRRIWDLVEMFIEQGAAPLDALKKAREHTTEEALQPYHNRAESRSTSLIRNFVEDLEQEARVEWLDERRWTHGRYAR